MATTNKKRTKAKAPNKAAQIIHEVVVDGTEITVDLSPLRNLRLMRRLKNDDFAALIELFEGMFGDQLDALEEQFDLVTVDDYNDFNARVMAEISPN